MTSDEWSQHRSYLNHTELSNGFRWALTPDREDYADAAIKGMNMQYSDPDEQGDFDETRKRIDGWPALREKILVHAKQITSYFNPFESAFNVLNLYLAAEDILWLRDIVKEDILTRFKIDQWKNDVIQTIKKIDIELKNVREGKSAVKDLRVATDNLKEVFSGRGYFNYGKSI